MSEIANVSGKIKADVDFTDVILHTKTGPYAVPYNGAAVVALVDPERETGPWYPVTRGAEIHLTHEEFTAWLGPQTKDGSALANREKML